MHTCAEAMEIRYRGKLIEAKKTRDQNQAGSRSRDADDDADDALPTDTRFRLSFEAMIAGLDEPLDDWLGFGGNAMAEVDPASGPSPGARWLITVDDDDDDAALLGDVARGTSEIGEPLAWRLVAAPGGRDAGRRRSPPSRCRHHRSGHAHRHA